MEQTSEVRFFQSKRAQIRLYLINIKALFTSTQKPKNFQDSPSYRIFRCMHVVLNIDENKN